MNIGKEIKNKDKEKIIKELLEQNWKMSRKIKDLQTQRKFSDDLVDEAKMIIEDHYSNKALKTKEELQKEIDSLEATNSALKEVKKRNDFTIMKLKEEVKELLEWKDCAIKLMGQKNKTVVKKETKVSEKPNSVSLYI